MHQRTGSVYLDTPPRPSRIPTKERMLSRSRVAGAVVGMGLIALTIAALITGLRILVLDDDLAVAAVDRTLDDPVAREELQRELARGIVDDLVGPDLAAVAAVYELDVAEEAERIAPLLLEDEAVRDEILSMTADVHARVFTDPDPGPVDLTALTDAARAVIDVNSPRLASIIPADAELWSIDAGALPSLAGVAGRIDALMSWAVLTSLLIPIGLVVHPRRHLMTAWIGHWVLGFGLLCGIAAVALPYLVGGLTGLRTTEIAIRSISLKLLAPAVMSGIIGVGLVSFAAVLRGRMRRRVTDEGAAVALGYDEPPFWQQSNGPAFDLSSRGLVDAGRPLTNI